MGSMKDLLPDGLYNGMPGYKEKETSKEAAHKIEGRAERLRRLALELITQDALTADEVASILGEAVLAIRPRITELIKAGKIRKSGRRGKNISGMSAHILEAV